MSKEKIEGDTVRGTERPADSAELGSANPSQGRENPPMRRRVEKLRRIIQELSGTLSLLVIVGSFYGEEWVENWLGRVWHSLWVHVAAWLLFLVGLHLVEQLVSWQKPEWLKNRFLAHIALLPPLVIPIVIASKTERIFELQPSLPIAGGALLLTLLVLLAYFSIAKTPLQHTTLYAWLNPEMISKVQERKDAVDDPGIYVNAEDTSGNTARKEKLHERRLLQASFLSATLISSLSLGFSMIFFTHQSSIDHERARTEKLKHEFEQEKSLAAGIAWDLLFSEEAVTGDNQTTIKPKGQIGFKRIAKNLFVIAGQGNVFKDRAGGFVSLDDQSGLSRKTYWKTWGSDYEGPGPYAMTAGWDRGQSVDREYGIQLYKETKCFEFFYLLEGYNAQQVGQKDVSQLYRSTFTQDRMCFQVRKSIDLVLDWHDLYDDLSKYDPNGKAFLEAKTRFLMACDHANVLVYPFRWGWQWTADGRPPDASWKQAPHAIAPRNTLKGVSEAHLELADTINESIYGSGVVARLHVEPKDKP